MQAGRLISFGPFVQPPSWIALLCISCFSIDFNLIIFPPSLGHKYRCIQMEFLWPTTHMCYVIFFPVLLVISVTVQILLKLLKQTV